MIRTLNIRAADARELVGQMRSVGRRVRFRTDAKPRDRQPETELFCLRRYVITVAANGGWRFPCTLSMGESPDFMIEFSRDCRGLEVTEATRPEYQAALTKAEKAETGFWSFDDGWVGDEPERAWCAAVIRATNRKVRKIAQAKYREAGYYDILIYSNHSSDVVRGHGRRRPEYPLLLQRLRRYAPHWKRIAPRLGIVSVIDGGILLHDILGKAVLWRLHDLRPVA